jgi:hypothetical protein
MFKEPTSIVLPVLAPEYGPICRLIAEALVPELICVFA